MKRMIFCNTYSQLILSIQLKLTLFENDEVDLWMSDSSNGVKEVYERMKDLMLFNDVKFLRLKQFNYDQSIWKDFSDLYSYNFGKLKIKFPVYDEVIFYNLTLFLYSISDFYYKIGHTAIWSKMEEGIFSYNTDFGRNKRVHISSYIRYFTKRPDVKRLIKKYYCLFPALKDTHLEWELIKVPDYSTKIVELRKHLNYVFNYKNPSIKWKYIYFASSSDVDNTPYGETELVIKLAELLGKDNFVVKMHPRDNRTIYSDNGINVLPNSYIPWEVVQLNLNMMNHYLLTVNSGAFISISAMMEQSVKAFFLYNIVHCGNAMFKFRKKQISSMLEKLHILGIGNEITDKYFDINCLCRDIQV